jgi:hypothetical protein
MPSRHRCFLLTPTDDVVITLRRYAFARDGVPPCGRQEPRYPGAELTTYETHDVEIEVARAAGTLEASLDGDRTQHTVALDDPRWPTTCACGYVFRPEDAKQESHTRLYQRGDNGELVTIGDAPVGALYDWRVLNGDDSYHRNGEMSLVCKTPAGEWMIDGPASNGPGWQRTGTPPDINVTPSIGIGSPQRMHGWLRNGWLEIDMP